MTDDIAIKVDNVSKTFKLPHEKNSSIKSAIIHFYKRDKGFEKQQALKDISFEVKKGEFFGIVGKNGSGKSTLLKILAGIYSSDTGGVSIKGKLIPFIELGVGFSPELSGRDNVFLNGSLLGFSRKEMKAMYNDIVEFAEIERFMDQKLKNFSSGMQVRLAFSIAIRAKSDVLLLDEVLAVGDAAFQQKCYNYFEELKQRKQTVVFVSHDMSAIKRFCTRAASINEGKIIFIGDPIKATDVYEQENLEVIDISNKRESAKIGNITQQKDKLTAKIRMRTDDEIQIEINYDTDDPKEEKYIGISLLLAGLSIGEINTLKDVVLTSSCVVTYNLDIRHLNSGTYEISVGLFKLKNREEINVGKIRVRFIIKGNDSTRGAALKLANTWQREQKKHDQNLDA